LTAVRLDQLELKSPGLRLYYGLAGDNLPLVVFRFRHFCIVAVLAFQCLPSTATSVRFKQYRTLVTPQAGETLQDRCAYQLLLPHSESRVNGVFVIFERGWQLGNLYYDPVIVDFAAVHQMGLLLAEHCRCKERGDMDVVPEHGIGPALFRALQQFASASNHPELAHAPLAYLSFSGGGSLVARMAGYAPD
jgi:hypothetical protein